MGIRVAPSVTLEAALAGVLAEGVGTGERLGELGRLGARLILQRAIEAEVAAFLQRARYERTPTAQGSRNGVRPRRIQTAEGELTIAVPQLRNTAARFISAVLPDSRMALRTRPLETLIIGAYVRGLFDRDVESLVTEAGLGAVSKSTVSRICHELKARYRTFRARALGRSTCWGSSWMPSTCRPDPAAPRRACWWPGGTPAPASGCCWTSAWGSASATRTGSTWGGRSPAGAGAPPPWWCPMGRPF